MQFDLSRFRDTFFQEVDEHLADMEAGLLRLEQSADPELLNAIFRCAHSIKGASGTFGFDAISRFTHSLETLLDHMRAGNVQPTRNRVDLLLQALDVLRRQVAAVKSGGELPADADEVAKILTVAQRRDWSAEQPAILRRSDQGRPPEGPVYRILFKPGCGIVRSGMDPVLVVRELSNAGQGAQVECLFEDLPPLAELVPDELYLGWRVRMSSSKKVSELRDIFAFVEDDADIQIEPEESSPQHDAEPARMSVPSQQARDATSIRVTTAKVDKLIDLVGELVIAQSMAAQILSDFRSARLPALREAFSEMERYTRELQERVMSVRMLPVGSLFSRFPRMVRDMASMLGKQIALDVSGEETELDKTVVESMADPLTHLIRNSIDHGIESPEDRRLSGKPECGVIRLRAFHQEGNVFIEVADDGRGLDVARIRAKAVERGLIREADELTDEAVRNLIFEPGFSTAESVSDLSGRGVGMDVVMRKVRELNGTVTVSSQPGAGAVVRVKLPLTLAILEGLLVKVGDQIYVLPLISILESIRPHQDQLRSPANRGELVVVRGEPLTLLRLHRLFGVPTDITDPTQGLLVLIESQGHRLALLVDELLGQQQVVIKSLETHFHKVPGVVGATILGDGRAALIVDAAGLVQISRVSQIAA